MVHPYFGMSWRNLRAVVRRYGPVAPRHRARLWRVEVSAALRSPLTAVEARLGTPDERAAVDVEPIFILGHWRSGTTWLYTLLSRSPEFGFVDPIATGLPHNFRVLGPALRPVFNAALPKHRLIDNVPVRADSPQEDEVGLANLCPLSHFHWLSFPQTLADALPRMLFFEGADNHDVEAWERSVARFLGKVSNVAGGKPILVKNPSHTARLDRLLRIFPRAKVIHLHRHPDEVFRSMRGFYENLLPALSFQEVPEIDFDGLILDTMEAMNRKFLRESEGLPSSRFVDLSYEELRQDPLGTLTHLYKKLALGDFSTARPAFEAHLEATVGYKRNPHHLAPEEQALVREKVALPFEVWGYER